jgi:glucose 1-dehydrogenase
MRGLTVRPAIPGSARLDDLPEPADADGALVVEAVAVGVCGTDREIAEGGYGEPPPGRDRLVLGHESLGRVVVAPAGATVRPGDLVVGIVRRPDPVPCANCAVGEWDMCRNGRYTERGIKQRDGYCVERYHLEPEFAVPVVPALGTLGVLLEPASVVAKAWEHIDRIGGRARWEPRVAFVIGAGPIGLLASLMAVQRGLEVHVLDRVTEGPKPQLVHGLGGTYHTGRLADMPPGPDVIIECTGVDRLVLDAIESVGPGGIVCLTGISSGRREIGIDATALNRTMVLENEAVFGSVNANRRHYGAAAEALAHADRRWLERLITRRLPLTRWQDALTAQPHDIKTIIEFG